MSIRLQIRHQLSARILLELDIEAGMRLAVMGPSGSGKSTLLRATAGLLQPQRGHIAWNGRVVFDAQRDINVPAHRRNVGYVPQHADLFPLLDVRQNLCFGRPHSPRLNLEQVVEALGLGQLLCRRPNMLSGGERQRVALGRAVLREPSILLCDEPFAALDYARRDALMPQLEAWRSELEVPLVVVTHEHEQARALADLTVTLESGDSG